MYPILENIILLLFLVLAISIVFRYLGLPQILGYLITGAIVGPHALALIQNVSDAQHLSTFGVVFLMFTVGLEFSLPRLFALRRAVFLLGGLQVTLCSVIVMLIGLKLGLSQYAGLIIGGILAMSSTAVTVKQLSNQAELHSPHGQNALGILLFQDLAVIPFFLLISGLGFLMKEPEMTHIVAGAILKGLFALIVIFILGKWLFRRLFHTIAATHIVELFTLAVLLVTLASAWMTQRFGLSFALGAFMAGMLLSETQFRHQIEVEIRPFRDLLLGWFFITIGMLLDVKDWAINWPWIILLFAGVSVGKILIIFPLSRFFGNDSFTSMRTALVLAQGGEFGFAMLTLALNNAIFSAEYGQVILGALLLSFASAPFLITFNEQIADFLFPKLPYLSEKEALQTLKEKTRGIQDHVILCGYGRIGQSIAALLERENIPHLALDLDPEHIREARLAGKPVHYGDATYPGILESAGILFAKALVISFDDPQMAVKILQYVNNANPLLPTMVRCKDDKGLALLEGYHASQIVVETHEESLMLIYHLLRTLKTPKIRIDHIIENIRRKHYVLLRQVFPGSYTEEFTEEGIPLKQLRSLILTDGGHAVGKTLGEVAEKIPDLEIVAVRRGKEYHHHPNEHLKLKSGDILILYGAAENLEKAEEFFLS